MTVKKVTRRNFLRAVASSAVGITATMLVGCAETGNDKVSSTSGNYLPSETDREEKPNSPIETPAESDSSDNASSFTVKGTIARSEEYKIEVVTRVEFYVGGTTVKVIYDGKEISIIAGKTYTDTIHTIQLFTLSKEIQNVKRLGGNLEDSIVFYVPEDTVVKSEFKQSDSNGNEFAGNEIQWVKTRNLKTHDELTELGDAGRISSGRSVAITRGGMYQFCWANEEDSYAVAGNVVFSVTEND